MRLKTELRVFQAWVVNCATVALMMAVGNYVPSVLGPAGTVDINGIDPVRGNLELVAPFSEVPSEPIQDRRYLALIIILPLLAIPFYFTPGSQHPFVLGFPAWMLTSLLVSLAFSATVAWGAQTLWLDSGAAAQMAKEQTERLKAERLAATGSTEEGGCPLVMATSVGLASALAAVSCFLLIAMSFAVATTPQSAADVERNARLTARHEAAAEVAVQSGASTGTEEHGIDSVALIGLLASLGFCVAGLSLVIPEQIKQRRAGQVGASASGSAEDPAAVAARFAPGDRVRYDNGYDGAVDGAVLLVEALADGRVMARVELDGPGQRVRTYMVIDLVAAPPPGLTAKLAEGAAAATTTTASPLDE